MWVKLLDHRNSDFASETFLKDFYQQIELLRNKLKKADPDAFVEFYDLVSPRLYRSICARIGSSSEAEDILQETFVRLVKASRQLGNAESPLAYAFAVARNELLRHMERKQRRPELTNQYQLQHSSDQQLSLDDACELLDLLEDADREIVELKIIGGLTFADIGLTVGRPAATIATRYRRAIGKLQQTLARSPDKTES